MSDTRTPQAVRLLWDKLSEYVMLKKLYPDTKPDVVRLLSEALLASHAEGARAAQQENEQLRNALQEVARQVDGIKADPFYQLAVKLQEIQRANSELVYPSSPTEPAQ